MSSNTPTSNTPNPHSTSIRTRRSATQRAGASGIDVANNSSKEIRDADTGKDYLLSNSFLVEGAECTIATLADTLLRITTLNMPRTTRNTIQAVVMLTKKANLEAMSLAFANTINNKLEEIYKPPTCLHQHQAATVPQADIDKVTADVTCSITNHLTEELVSIHKQITDFTTSISENTSKIADNMTTD